MSSDEPQPLSPGGDLPAWPGFPAGQRYLLPAEQSDIAVREVTYGSKSIGHELLEAIVLSLLIFLMVQAVVQNRKVVGQSMEPSLQNNEHLLIDRASYFAYDTNFLGNALLRLQGRDSDVQEHTAYLLAGPKRGDVVVFRPPVENNNEDYIKRVIGLPGETVEVKANDGVYINGIQLKEPYIKDVPNYSWPTNGQSGVVPPGRVFVLGDNRNNSSDSHAWGFLDLRSVVGRALVSYWPQDLWGILPQPSYAIESPRVMTLPAATP